MDKPRIKKILISEEDIHNKVREAGEYITRKYEGKPLLMVSILNGAFVFMADLCREVRIPCEIAFMSVKSYDGKTSEKVEIVKDIDREDLSRYHIVIVEDIIDTGKTLFKIADILKKRDPLSLEIITLLDKPERREVPFKADMCLFTIPDVFVVGYGLDCDEQFRGLPYVAEIY